MSDVPTGSTSPKPLLSILNTESEPQVKVKCTDIPTPTTHPLNAVDEELSQVRINSIELEERLQTVLEQMRRALDDKERIVDELRTTLREEQQARTAVDEELTQARINATELEERLQTDLEQMRRALDDKERIADELRTTLREEQQARTAVDEELTQARIISTKLEEGLRNDLEQMRRALDERDKTVDELQLSRTALGEELSQAEISYTELEERLHNELTQFRGTLDDREKLLDELLRALEEEGRARTAADDELNRARSVCADLEGRLEYERQANNSRLEEEQQQRTAAEERVRQLQSAVSAAEQALAESQDWIIDRDEVILSENTLGRGAWGAVREGTFRGCKVAVKEIHGLIVSDYNLTLFEREMSIASRCRHPNLLQFIGATKDGGSPLFVSELLDTSLRHVLQQRALNHEEIVCLSLDIAKGLNYLHLCKPVPIMHRDISSGNVLLWKRDDSWRAKLSDYGAANFMRYQMTENPGALIYSAPEALTHQQSPKV